MTRDGGRGTPQPCQKQEPTGRQKGKCQDWGTSQEGTQKTGLPAHHWSPRTSAHCPSRGLLPHLVPPAAAPPTQASPWLSVAPHHIFRESPEFLRSAFKPCQHVSPTFLLPLVFIPDSGYSRFLTPGPLHNTPVHLTSFHTFAPAVLATRTLWSLSASYSASKASSNVIPFIILCPLQGIWVTPSSRVHPSPRAHHSWCFWQHSEQFLGKNHMFLDDRWMSMANQCLAKHSLHEWLNARKMLSGLPWLSND